MMYADE
jgi:hypothetical protein